jgi:hypothetical protein
MRFTLARLEEHQKSVAERLGAGFNAASAEDRVSFDKLQNEANTVWHCLAFCSDVDTYVESHISNIENHAEGDDTTNNKPINGKNRGIGKRQKQAGGHFGEASLQQMSQDFKSTAIHQSGHVEQEKQRSATPSGNEAPPASPQSQFGNRHGRGFVLAKIPASKLPSDTVQ